MMKSLYMTMRWNKRLSLPGMCLAALCVALHPMRAEEMAPPSGLLCNLLRSPEKSLITKVPPDFGWIVPSNHPGDSQTAYQILVASTPTLLVPGRADLWDSGKTNSDQSLHVLYKGKALRAGTSYWWTVRTWDKQQQPTPFSEPQQFHIGDLNHQKAWPAESRWVPLNDAAGNQSWTFEDRPPVDYHPQKPESVQRNEDGSWFLDFGKAAFSTLELTLDWPQPGAGKEEHLIAVALGEQRQGTTVHPKPGGGIIYQVVELKIKPGAHAYQLEIPRHDAEYPHSQRMPMMMPEVLPFRYGQILPQGIDLGVKDAVQKRLWVEFDDEAARFTSSNERLNAVYELCKYSVKVNTFNGDYAASQRERMMYEADSHIHQMSHYATDRNFATARYSMENQIFHASWPTEWISHCIFMAWADYLHTGNKRSIERFYDELKPKTLMALRDEHDLISTRTGKADKAFQQSIHLNKGIRDIVDWPKGETDGYDFRKYNTVVNAFHYRSLVLMAQMAEALDKTKDAEFYRREADKVLESVNRLMWDSGKGLYRDGIESDHHSFHANLFPLAFGMVPEDRQQKVVEYIISRGMACSVYPTGYLLETLFDQGETQAAIDLMTATHDRSWMHMIELGSTVTTEAWDIKYKPNSGWTHAWSSAPAQILPRKLVGIEPLEPGFGRIRIHPRPGDVTSAEARLPTIRGPVEASFRQVPGQSFELEVSLPANTQTRIELPLGAGQAQVLMNGQPVNYRKEKGRAVIENVGSGSHRFSVQ